MSGDALHDQGRALEDVFFKDQDPGHLKKIKEQLQDDADRKTLSDISGIGDIKTLNLLLAAGIRPETLAAVGMIPLVVVAWSDQRMEDRERTAILHAASETGLDETHPAIALIKSWLDLMPGDELFNTWKAYVRQMCKSLPASSIEQVKNHIVGRAKRVAESAGGFLGVINTVDRRERDIIRQLEEVFD